MAVSPPGSEEETRRLGLIRMSLWECGVELPSAELINYRAPTPINFFGAAPIIDTILSRLSVDFTQEPTKELKDQNDIFHSPFHRSHGGPPRIRCDNFVAKAYRRLTNNAFPPREKTPAFGVALCLDELNEENQKNRDSDH